MKNDKNKTFKTLDGKIFDNENDANIYDLKKEKDFEKFYHDVFALFFLDGDVIRVNKLSRFEKNIDKFLRFVFYNKKRIIELLEKIDD